MSITTGFHVLDTDINWHWDPLIVTDRLPSVAGVNDFENPEPLIIIGDPPLADKVLGLIVSNIIRDINLLKHAESNIA